MACGHGVCAWCVDMVCVVHDGRGRRPRRPAYTMSSPMSSPWARRAGDVGCNEIFMQSQRVLAAENAKDAKAHAAQSTCLRSLTR